MHKHSAKQDPNGVYTLFRDDMPTSCPKQMFPQMVTSQKSAVSPIEYMTQLMNLPCSTKCPFAQVSLNDITKQGRKNVYTISCEGGVKNILLDEVVQAEKLKPGLTTSALTIAEK